MALRSIVGALLLSAGACSTIAWAAPAEAPLRSPRPRCELAPADRQWLNGSIAAWNYALAELAQARVGQLSALVFDRQCKLSSGTAMTGGAATWSGVGHDGSVPLPDGKSMPAQVASFAAPAGEQAFFVMAAPSIWTAGGVEGGALTLEKLMTAVLLHEGSHVLQFPTYGKEMTALAARHGWPDSFNDDSIQGRFEADRDFAASIARETDLLFAAAAADAPSEARKLAREARRLMLSRQERWFRGQDAGLREAEEIWLTMEGSGQWLAYRWLTDPKGGAVPADVALREFARRGKSWSQKQGIALFLALERLAPAGWKARVFGGGSEKATQLIDAALAAEN
jgi:hypothetical protein